MWRQITLGIVLAGVLSLLVSSVAGALEVPSAPSLAVPIVDTTSTLTRDQVTKLADQIRLSREQKSYQIGILMIPSLQGQVLEEYSLSVARKWGIGDATNNGVLLIVVKNDRVMRIEVGRGLEGDLTDTRAKKIITNVIRPKFTAGDYYGGISAAVDSIQLAVTKQADSALAAKSSAAGEEAFAGLWSIFGFFALPLIWLGAILGRSKSWWAGGVVGGVIGGVTMLATGAHWWSILVTVALVPFGLLCDFLVSRNYREHKTIGILPSWWAGGGTFGGRGGIGGGGGSFGGGGFSGGGSSGSW